MLEPPDVDVLVVDVLADSVFLVSVEVVLLDVEDDVCDSVFLEPPLLAYRSEYQPPPLRMKPAPPETWRLAVA